MKKRRAIILLSGGLDSTLAAYIMKEQDVELYGVYFKSPFAAGSNKELAAQTAAKLKIPFRVEYLADDYFDIIISPKHGYGKYMNPCIDCRIYMLKLAGEIMKDEKCDFVVTGEVLGQRPMSQHLKAMDLIEREAELEGLILRPLSAKVLAPTIPEKAGWIDRDKLLSITGRSRKIQMEIAKRFNVSKTDYASPAGGCRLTMKEYSRKLKDLIEFNGKLSLEDITLLNKGRHFRITDDFKIIVGRNQAENELLDKLANDGEIKMWADGYMGPLCLGIGKADKNNLRVMGRICGRYSDCGNDRNIKFIYSIGISKKSDTGLGGLGERICFLPGGDSERSERQRGKAPMEVASESELTCYRDKKHSLEAVPFDQKEILRYKIY